MCYRREAEEDYACGKRAQLKAPSGNGGRLEAMPAAEMTAVKIRRDWSKSAVLGERSAKARTYADLVASQLVDTVLPLSQRESLIRLAARQGINRFEANLIIAAVQNQLEVGRTRPAPPPPKRAMRIAAGIAMFVVIQAGIVAAAWYWL